MQKTSSPTTPSDPYNGAGPVPVHVFLTLERPGIFTHKQYYDNMRFLMREVTQYSIQDQGS